MDQQEQEPHDMEMGAESDDEKKTGDKKGRRKIKIELIEDKSRRHITFSKRKLGIMKKAWELATLTGTQVLLLVASETGHVYTFATPKLQPLITKPEGKNLIQACLNAPDTITVQPPSMPTPRAPGRYDMPQGQEFEEDKTRPYPGMAAGRPGGMPYQPAYQPGVPYAPQVKNATYYNNAGGAPAGQAPQDPSEGQ